VTTNDPLKFVQNILNECCVFEFDQVVLFLSKVLRSYSSAKNMHHLKGRVQCFSMQDCRL